MFRPSRSRFVNRIGRALQEALPTDCHGRVVADVLTATGFENVAILLIESGTGRLLPHALGVPEDGEGARASDEELVRSRGTRIGVGLTGWTAQTGESVRVADVRRDARYHPLREGIRSELCVPLKLDRRWVGVLNVESPRRRAYSRLDQRLLETVGTQVALGIRHDRLSAIERGTTHAAERAHPRAGIRAVCAQCRKIRDPDGRWSDFSAHLLRYDGIEFTHGLCPDCIPDR